MQPAARIGDMHVCPMVTPGTPPVPHVGGPITGPGVPNVLIGFMPAATITDMCVCVGPPDVIAKGSAAVLIGGKPAARMGDMTAHGGTIVAGCPTVLIGDSGSAGGGGGGAVATATAGSVASSPATEKVAKLVSQAYSEADEATVTPVTRDQVGPLEPEQEEKEKTWIGIQLEDVDGTPVANENFKVTLEGGQVLSGTTDDEGYAHFDDIDPDQGKVDFFNIPDSGEQETGESTDASDDPQNLLE
jgi:uncharacterized Zn-binding protein involved in type VI secretion